MTEQLIDDAALIVFLRQKRQKLEEQLANITATIDSLSPNGRPKEAKTAESSHKSVQKPTDRAPTLHAAIVDTVLELATEKGRPVGVAEVVSALDGKGVDIGGATNRKTRVSGALSREILHGKPPRIKKAGRGMFREA